MLVLREETLIEKTMTQTHEAIAFRQARDAGDVLNITFQFLRQNVVKLGKSLLFFVAPAMALATALSTQLQSSMIDPDSAIGINLGVLGVVYALSLLASVLAVTVVYGYIILYQDYGPDGFDLRDVWHVTLVRFFRILGTMLFLMFLVFVGYIALAIPMVLLIAAGTAFGGVGTVGAILVSVLLVFAFLGLIAYFAVILSLIFPMRMREPIGVWAATGRCFKLVKNNWWATFAVLFVAFLVYLVLSIAVGLPYYMLYFSGGFMTLEGGGPPVTGLLVALSVVASVGGALLYSVPLTATAFQYFSLVERKERTGLMGRIDAVGVGTNDDAREPSAPDGPANPF